MTNTVWVPEVGDVARVENPYGYAISYGENVIGEDVEVVAFFDCDGIPMVVVEDDGVCYCFRSDMLTYPMSDEDRNVIKMIADAGLNDEHTTG